MNSFIVYPQNKAQEKAVKAIFEALNVVFEKVTDPTQREVLPPHVVEAVRKSEEQIKNGEFYSHEEVMKKFEKYL